MQVLKTVFGKGNGVAVALAVGAAQELLVGVDGRGCIAELFTGVCEAEVRGAVVSVDGKRGCIIAAGRFPGMA